MDVEERIAAQRKAQREAVSQGVMQFILGVGLLAGCMYLLGHVVAFAVYGWNETLWILPLPLFFGYLLLMTMYFASGQVCDTLAFNWEHHAGLFVIALVGSAFWYVAANAPLGGGPHRTRVRLVPLGAVRIAEVEWKRTGDEVRLDRIHTREGQPIELYGCEGRPEEFDARCEGENERKWLIVPYPAY